MSDTRKIRFQITMTPTDLPAIGAWANGFALTKELTGDLNGSSEGLFINAGQVEGSRSYIVVEKLSGTTAEGGEASVIVEHGGVENDDAAWFGRIVPGTGTGDWEGMTGTITFDGDDEGEFMLLSFN